MSETKIVFVGGGEMRIHEEMESVQTKLTTAAGNWVVLERGITKQHPVSVNPANVAYLESVAELEPLGEELEPVALTHDYGSY